MLFGLLVSTKHNCLFKNIFFVICIYLIFLDLTVKKQIEYIFIKVNSISTLKL